MLKNAMPARDAGSFSDVDNSKSTDASEVLRSSISNQDQLEYQKSAHFYTGPVSTAGEGSFEIIPRNNVNQGENVAGTYTNGHRFDTVVDTPSELRDRAQRIFNDLDTDQNSYISRTELNDALRSHRFSGKDEQVVAGLSVAFDGMSQMSYDQFLRNSGISKNDIDKIDSIDRRSQLAKADALVNWTSQNFRKLDQDGNGKITFSEIEGAQSWSNNPNDRNMLQLLKNRYTDIAGTVKQIFMGPGFSRWDLNSYSHSFDGMRTEQNTVDAALKGAAIKGDQQNRQREIEQQERDRREKEKDQRAGETQPARKIRKPDIILFEK